MCINSLGIIYLSAGGSHKEESRTYYTDESHIVGSSLHGDRGISERVYDDMLWALAFCQQRLASPSEKLLRYFWL